GSARIEPGRRQSVGSDPADGDRMAQGPRREDRQRWDIPADARAGADAGVSENGFEQGVGEVTRPRCTGEDGGLAARQAPVPCGDRTTARCQPWPRTFRGTPPETPRGAAPARGLATRGGPAMVEGRRPGPADDAAEVRREKDGPNARGRVAPAK